MVGIQCWGYYQWDILGILAPNQWDRGGNGCVAGGWGGQMLWEAKALEGNGKMAESEQTKTQNSWVNDEQKNL